MTAHEHELTELVRNAHAPHPPSHEEPAPHAPVEGRRDALTPASLLHLQRSAGNAGVVQLLGEKEEEEEDRSPVKDVVGSGGGHALDGETRDFMESRFGTDFGDVRVHTDGRASESAGAVGAHAYTVGTDVVFQSGQYSPGTDSGQRMLAHELTHVVQQKAGPVDGTPAPGGIKISSPSDRFEREADSVADDVMTGQRNASTATGQAPGAPALQRQEEDEEEVQEFAVQRQEEDEEEVQESAVQRQEEDEEEVQESAVQRQEAPEEEMEEEAPA